MRFAELIPNKPSRRRVTIDGELNRTVLPRIARWSNTPELVLPGFGRVDSIPFIPGRGCKKFYDIDWPPLPDSVGRVVDPFWREVGFVGRVGLEGVVGMVGFA